MVSICALICAQRASISSLVPAPSISLVVSLPITADLVSPSISRVTLSSDRPTSSETSVAPVKIAISCNMALRRSPKPGALTAATFTIPRILLITNVANASPSTSSAIINSGRPDFETASRVGSKSRMLEIFLSNNKINGCSSSAIILSALVTKCGDR